MRISDWSSDGCSSDLLALTPAGAWYVQQVIPAVRRIELATDSLRSGAHRQELVRISVQPTFADYWLMPKLNHFSLDHPETCLDIVVRSGDADSTDAEIGRAHV